jgi:hypothetical protein
MNARLRPNQLKPGEVALSKNGRMNDDGTWQPRKGLSTLFGSITSGEDAVRIPYLVTAGQRDNSGNVTLVLDDTPSLAFIPGENITIEGLGYTNATDPNGTFVLVSVNFTTKTITYSDGSSGEQEAFTIAGNSVGATSVASIGNSIATTLNYVVTAASRTSNVVTLTLQDTPSSNFTVSSLVYIDNIDVSINGSHTITAINVSAKTISFANTGADTTFSTQGASVGNTSVASSTQNFIINDEGVNAVYGSAVYSDASSNNDDYIFSATNNLCVIIRLKDSALFKCRYEAGGETVDNPVGMAQGFDKMFIFRSRKTTLSASPKLIYRSVSSASQSGQVITVNTTADHGRSVGDFVTLTNFTGWPTYDPNNCYQIKTAPTSTSFTVEMADSQTVASYNVSGAQVEYFEDFTRVSNGAYTTPAYFTDTSATALNGVVTMNIGAGHNLQKGDEITIRNATSPYELFVNQKAVVTSVFDSSGSASNPFLKFTFNLGVQDESSGASLTVSKALAIGKGYEHMPAAPWGEFHQRRLWVPYWYTGDTIPVDREIRDELAASDIFDSDTFDIIGNQFRASAGKSDYLVGLQPFTQDSIVAFNRKSIHLLTGVSGSLSDVSTNVVTSEIGASARKSIVQVANKILFLSDQGIYSVEFLDAYNLRGTGTPISETIQPYIDRINQDYAHLSCAVYFNNRYWIALPLDSAPGNGNGRKLNTIIIFNFINGGFESIDSVNSIDFAIRELIVAREGAQNALYITTEEGGVHKVDAVEGGDIVSVTPGQADEKTIPVISQLTTRQFDADSMDRKVFSRSEIHVKSNSGSQTNADIQFITEDPDSVSDTTSFSSLLGSTLPDSEEASLRTRINKRGFGVQADIQPSLGRPYIRAVKVDARITNRSTTSIS